jgi:hypothetical protein
VPTFTDAQLAAIAQLPSHPVFLTDLSAGVVALAIRFDVRDTDTRRDESNYSFPGFDNAQQISNVLNLVAGRLGALVDVTPLLAVLARCTDGPRHPERDAHHQLETLAALGCDPGHVIIETTDADNLAIERFLGAAHLALFGMLPTQVGEKIVGCEDCATYHNADGSPYRGGGRPWTGSVIGEANTDGHLAPGYRIPSALEADARWAQRKCIFVGVRARHALELALIAPTLVAELEPRDLAYIEANDPALWARARAFGLVHDTEYALV